MDYKNKRPKTIDVYEQIRHRIKSNEYAPGMHLVEKILAEQFSCSRSCVREVLKMLQSDGLVEIIANRGAFVTQLPFEQTIDALYVQEALNLIAVRLLSEKSNPKSIQNLENQMQMVKTSIEAGDYVVAYQHSLVFHRLLCLESGNQLLSHFFTLAEDLVGQGYVQLPLLKDLQSSYEEHMRILEAIRNGDSQCAEDAVRNHFDANRECLRKS